MNPHLQRAQVLLQQHRPELAEESLRRALVDEPQLAPAHSLLGLCLAARKQFAEAESEAGQAIGLAPDNPFSHYAMASVLEDRNKLPQAEAAIRQAIALDPADADYHATLAQILLRREDKAGALAASESALQFDPDHMGANNLRAIALTQLGRKAEAGQSIEATLSRNPDDAVSHANRAWTLLHEGRPKNALPHFREALRLDPNNEWARAGCVEAMKAGNPFYAVMLRYFLWTSRLSSQARWGLFLGLWFGHKLLRGAGKSHPALAPFVLPITVLYLSFVLSTWLASPLFNLLLRLSPYGRHLLHDDQRRQAQAVGIALAAGALFLTAWLVTGMRHLGLACSAGACAALSLPLAGVFSCPRGWPRTTMVCITSGLGLLAALTCLLAIAEATTGSQIAGSLLTLPFCVTIIGVALMTWITPLLSSRTVTR